jgi:hypothetical protein
MTKLFPYYQLIEDLRDSYDLDEDETKTLEGRTHALMSSGNLSIYDLNDKLSTIPTQFVIGDKSIQLDADEVNRLYAKQGNTFKWKPRKKRGAPLKLDSLKRLKENGQLAEDAKAAAAIVEKKTPYNVNNKTVADQMSKNYGSKWSASAIERQLRKKMYKNRDN